MCIGNTIRRTWPAICLFLCAAQARAQPADAGALVRTEAVRLEQVRERRTMTGQIEPARRSLLTSELDGLIIHAPPEPGVAVKKGQVLARLEDSLIRAELAAAQAETKEASAQVAERKALLDQSERNLVLYTGLFDTGAATQQEMDEILSTTEAERARHQLALAVHDRAHAMLSLANQRLAKTEIKSPFDAFVVSKSTELGQWAQAGEPVCELVDISQVKARIHVPEAMVGSVPRDEPIALHIPAINKTCRFPLFSVVPDGDPNTRTFALLIKIDNEDSAILPGMSVTADLPTGQTLEALTLPRDALHTTPVGTVVFAERGGIAVMLQVTLRFADGDRFVVQGELRDGERVVIEGHERLQPGMKLRELPAR